MFLRRIIHLPVSAETVRKRLREISAAGSTPQESENEFCVSVSVRKFGRRGSNTPRVYSGTLIPEEGGTVIRYTVNPHPGGLLFASAGICLAAAQLIQMSRKMFLLSLAVAVLSILFTLADEAEHLDHFEILCNDLN